MKLRFAKMHGLGNDFMVVDLVTQHVELDARLVRGWSDRRTGVGFDQLLAALPPDDPEADFRYRIFNADGREAEQCGNGARCFARFVVEQRLTVKRSLLLQTLAGDIRTEVLSGGDVQVEMGVPTTAPATVPFLSDQEALSYRVGLGGGRAVELTPVSVGNPHAVVFVDDLASAEVGAVGAALQHHEQFPEQVNVGFLEVRERGAGRLRVYERGVGETRACGSGACAAMVAARLHGRLDEEADIALPGGTLRMAWRGPGSPVTLSGSARLVYTGRIEL